MSVRAAWVGRNRGPSHRLKGSKGSQILARCLEVKVQAGEEHPWPWHTPFTSPGVSPLSPTHLLKDRGGGLCWLHYGWSRRGGVWGLLVFCSRGVRDVQVRMYCGTRRGGFGRVGWFLEGFGFLQTRGYVIAEIMGPRSEWGARYPSPHSSASPPVVEDLLYVLVDVAKV